jgi:hypothetical protein
MRVLGDFLTEKRSALRGSFVEKSGYCERGGASRLRINKTAALHKKKNALALVVGCGRLAAFAAPLL